MAVGREELSVLGRPHQTTDLVWVGTDMFVEGRGRGGREGEREVGYIAVIELVYSLKLNSFVRYNNTTLHLVS